MFYLMLLFNFCFVLICLVIAKRTTFYIEEQTHQEVIEAELLYKKEVEKRKKVFLEKREMESKANKIFTLYEISKEITKRTHEQEAFEIFKVNLKKNIDFKNCWLVSISSGEYCAIHIREENLIFPLKTKDRTLGYLVIEGIDPSAREEALILAQQFALVLQRIELYERIERLSITDSLTGVHTRRYCLERLREELKRSKFRKINISVLMMDIDLFKTFNDRYGHLVGDWILKEAGKIIKDNIRNIDIAGRYGGEEFCVILPDTTRDGASFVAERIRVAMEKASIKAYDTTASITVSIGVSTFPLDGRKLEELVDKADWALYRAKKRGRNRVCAFGIYE